MPRQPQTQTRQTQTHHCPEAGLTLALSYYLIKAKGNEKTVASHFVAFTCQ
jgi:hypothetical protein